MNQEEAKEYQKQFKEYRKSLYSEYPETERFEKRKTRFGLFLLCYCLILYLVKAFMMELSGFLFFKGLITGVGVSMIFILAAMGNKWKIACCLYLLVVMHLTAYVQVFKAAGLTFWEQFHYAYIDGFSQYPHCRSAWITLPGL